MQNLNKQIQELNEELMGLSQDIGDAQCNLREKEAGVVRCSQEVSELRRRQEEMTKERKSLWRQESELEEKLKQLSVEHER